MSGNGPTAEAKLLIGEIDAEVASERHRRTNLQTVAIRPLKSDFLRFLTDQREHVGRASRELRGELEAHIAAVDMAFQRLEQAIQNAGRASSRVRRYSDEAKDAAVPAYAKYVAIRNMFGGRLGDSPLARGVKDELGVGQAVESGSPLDVWDAGLKQLEALRRADAQPLYKARGLRVAHHATALEKVLGKLRAEIDKGVGGPKKGEATDDVNTAARFLEVALDRSGVLLEDAGLDAAAEDWRARIPRRHARRSTDRGPAEDSVVTPAGGGTKPTADATKPVTDPSSDVVPEPV